MVEPVPKTDGYGLVPDTGRYVVSPDGRPRRPDSVDRREQLACLVKKGGANLKCRSRCTGTDQTCGELLDSVPVRLTNQQHENYSFPLGSGRRSTMLISTRFETHVWDSMPSRWTVVLLS